MASEPITLFSRTIDPAGVARMLRERYPQATVIDGPDDAWTEAAVTFGKGRKKQVVTFTHDPAYYAEANWSRQMSGMQGYFSRFPEGREQERAMLLITSFKFSLGTLTNSDLGDGDPRLGVIAEVAVASAHSAAQERHQAANWLLGGPATFSEASVAT